MFTGFPLVDSYRIQHAYTVRSRPARNTRRPGTSSENIPRLLTPGRQGRAIAELGHAVLLSSARPPGRTGPTTVPAIEKERYYSIQLIDLYTHNFDYIGSRAHRQRWWQLHDRRPEWKARDAQRREQGHSCRDRACVLAGYRTQLFIAGRPRHRKEDPERLQGAASVGVPRPARAHGRRRRSTSSSH